MRLRKKFLIIAICLFAMLASVLVYANFKILKFRADILHNISDAPGGTASTLAIIFGGGVKANGELGGLTADRMQVGVELFKAGKVGTIMITGDDGALRMNEVDPMYEAAVKAGVPTSSIIVDRHGYRTYESCYRARAVFGVDNALAVSQNFHLPRILYLCRGMGLNATGISADIKRFGLRDNIYMAGREILARVKAWWQLEVTRPLPTSLTI